MKSPLSIFYTENRFLQVFSEEIQLKLLFLDVLKRKDFQKYVLNLSAVGFYRINTHIMQNSNNPLIFVVEDNKIYNKLLVKHLESNRLTNVKSFFTGEECLEHMKEKPAIIIQDYLLEGMNGIEVLKKGKQISPETEFIFLSGQDSMEVAVNTMKYGAYDYIVKDQMTLDKMIDKVRKIMSVKKLEKTNKSYKIGRVLFFIILVIIILAIVGFFLSYFSDNL